MPSYQVIGYFLPAPDTLVCRGGKTGDRKLAEERLLEAEVYTATRRTCGGQPMKWWIERRP